jgi:hypothetical protein
MLLTRVLKPVGSGRNHPQLKDFAKLGSDACEVIAARTAQGMTGTLSAAEAVPHDRGKAGRGRAGMVHIHEARFEWRTQFSIRLVF